MQYDCCISTENLSSCLQSNINPIYMLGVTLMSNENQTPALTPESAQNTDKASPFLTEPLPQGTAQGQQQIGRAHV